MGQCSVPKMRTKKEPATHSLHNGLVLNRKENFLSTYVVERQIGQGSMATVSVVRKKLTRSPLTQASGIPEDIPMNGPRRFSSFGSRGSSLNSSQCSSLSSYNPGAYTLSKSSRSRKFAMKTIYTNRINKNLVNEIRNEINVLRQLDHPNIIQLLEVYEYRKRIYLLMELCEGGPLQIKLYTEAQTCHIMGQILRALVYLHEQNIVHRDIKMENIVLENFIDEYPTVKLIDFGLSQVYTCSEKLRAVCGTIYTLAPEVITGEGYTAKVDMWATGVLMYLMISNEFPFLTNEFELQDEVKKKRFMEGKFFFSSPIWSNVSKEAQTLITNLLKRNINLRWSARQALSFLTETWHPKLLGLSQSSMKEKFPEDDMPDIPTPSLMPSPSRDRLASDIILSMQRFSGYGEMKKAALMMTAFYMDKSALRDLREAFISIDHEANGVITWGELRKALQEHPNIDDEEMARVFGSLDVDHTGKIHYLEFLAASLEARGYVEEERLADAFERLDVDHKGRISKEDLQALLGTSYTEELAKKMIKEADYKNCGYIDYEEFMKLMKPTIHRQLKDEIEVVQEMQQHRPTSGSIDLYNEVALAVQKTLPRRKYSQEVDQHKHLTSSIFESPSEEELNQIGIKQCNSESHLIQKDFGSPNGQTTVQQQPQSSPNDIIIRLADGPFGEEYQTCNEDETLAPHTPNILKSQPAPLKSPSQLNKTPDVDFSTSDM